MDLHETETLMQTSSTFSDLQQQKKHISVKRKEKKKEVSLHTGVTVYPDVFNQ